MFGLVALQRVLHPETTLDKIFFIIEHAFTDANLRTTTISFAALAALVLLRNFKGFFKKYWWIYRLPEVLIVVAVSTCTCAVLSIAFLRHALLSISHTPRNSPLCRIPLGSRRRRYSRRRSDQHRCFFHPISNPSIQPQVPTQNNLNCRVRIVCFSRVPRQC